MKETKTVRVISNVIYAIGAVIAFILIIISLFGPNKAVNPMAMIPFTWKEQAYIWLAFGTIPMLLACAAVYKFNAIKNTPRKKRYSILIFFPGLICSVCALSIIGIIIAGMINSLTH